MARKKADNIILVFASSSCQNSLQMLHSQTCYVKKHDVIISLMRRCCLHVWWSSNKFETTDFVFHLQHCSSMRTRFYSTTMFCSNTSTKSTHSYQSHTRIFYCLSDLGKLLQYYVGKLIKNREWQKRRKLNKNGKELTTKHDDEGRTTTIGE